MVLLGFRRKKNYNEQIYKARIICIKRTMDVNVIFKNKISIDNDENFVIEFKNGEEVISILLNKKKRLFPD